MSTIKETSRGIAVLLALSGPVAHASSSVEFGNELLQRGQFQAASLEFQRALVEHPDAGGSGAADIADKALQALWLNRDYKGSSELAEFYVVKYRRRPDLTCISQYYLGLSYYGLKGYPRAQSELAQASAVCGEPYLSRARYWSGLGYMQRGDFNEARKSFEGIDPISLKHPDSAIALNAISLAEHLPRKSPRRASLLNVFLPGSGYAYAGYPQTGAISFLTNGLFAWGTVAAAQNGQTALAVILGSLNLAWYFGGIQGAGNAAARANERRLHAVIKPLEIN